MSAETLRVRIEAHDAASATLAGIGRAATELVRVLERLEAQATRAMSELPAPKMVGPEPAGARAGSQASSVVLRVDDRATPTVTALGELLGRLDGTVATPRLEADTAGTAAALVMTEAQVRALDGLTARLVVEADTAGAEAGLAAARAVQQDLDTSVATVTVRADTAGAVAGLALARAQMDALGGTGVTVAVRAETAGAVAALAVISSQHAALDGRTAALQVTAVTAGAQAALATTRSQHRALDGAPATLVVGANTLLASGAMAGVRAAHAALDGVTATLKIDADTGGAAAGIGWAAGYAGRVLATSYIDIVTRRSTLTIGPTARHGGVPRYAHGGVVLAEMHEAGPETLHFANGGSGVTTGRGTYAVPTGTYVSPAPASTGRLGGGDVHVHVHGNVYGIDDLTEQVTRQLAPAIAGTARDIHAGQVRVQ